MVRSYMRHGATEAFGLVCGSSSNSLFDGKLAYVPALEDVLVWNMKSGEKLAMWHDTGHTALVTCLARAPQENLFAVGYADGSIRLWDLHTGAVLVRFNGHRKAVTAIVFDPSGSRIASGSQDTDIILWDVVAGEGLKRLTGHRDQITSLHFLTHANANSREPFLLSTSKDTYIKVWDISSWFCVETVVGHRSEVWCCDSDPTGTYLLTGSSEGEAKGWKIDGNALKDGIKESLSGELSKIISPMGSLPLASSQRVSHIQFHKTQPFLAIQSHDRSVEIFRVRAAEEIKKKAIRRLKRAEDKKRTANSQVDGDASNHSVLSDMLSPFLVVRPSGKIRSFSFEPDRSSTAKSILLFLALVTNAAEVYSVPLPRTIQDKEMPEAHKIYSLDLQGHRTDIRTLSLSSDDAMLASASNGQVKIWSMKSYACIRTVECGYAICSSFLPGDRILALGYKDGGIILLDVASGTPIQEIEAHNGTVWSMHCSSGTVATGSADKTVKFWDLKRSANLLNGNTIGIGHAFQSGKLLLEHSRTLKVSEDVLSVRISSNAKYIAVALLDSTVKVFYFDTLKYYISLYGHKLPVLSMDISNDSKVLVTCSADKNIKIWGLDFGDCHRSLFAHDESIMQVAFESDSHYFWSVSKDGLLKYWDGVKFDLIQKLEGHQGEIWAMALSNEGKFVVTASHDRSIRVWEKLDEPLFLEEERERELEEMHEKGIADEMNHNRTEDDHTNKLSTAPDQASAVQKQTTETLLAGERITEAIDIADAERSSARAHEQAKAGVSNDVALAMPNPPRNPVLAAYDLEPDAYVLMIIDKTPSAALTDALLTLPFSRVVSLLVYINIWVEKGNDITLVSRVLFFVLRAYHDQIAANQVTRSTLIPLRQHMRSNIQKQRQTLVYNLSALKFLHQNHTTIFPDDDLSVSAMTETKSGERATMKKRKRVKI